MHGSILTVADLVASRAEQNPDAVAIFAQAASPMTYGALRDQVGRTVERLNGWGIGRGDRVGIVLPNGPQLAAAFIGVAAGATAAPLNPGYKADEFDFYLGDVDAKAVIVAAGDTSPVVGVSRARGIPVFKLRAADGPAGAFTLTGGEAVPCDHGGFADADDVAMVLHTSGTTSRPKIVPLSQRNLMASAENIRRSLHLGAGDRSLNVMPLFHVHGLICAVLGSLTAGGSVFCSPGFHPIDFFDWLDEARPTWFTAVPTMHQAILARAVDHGDVIARTPLRFVRSCSAALPPQVMDGMEAAFGVPMIEAYGMTEAAHQMASNPLPPGERRAGSVGIAAGPEVAIMDAKGRLLAPGETGEIVIRGANVMAAYENNPKANAENFQDGWFRTGDQGVMDAAGYLTITGRLKEIINRGGEGITPREIDEVMLDHPAVGQAVAFAVPDPTLGEDVGAAIVLKEGGTATERDIRDFVAARLAAFKVPRHVVFVPAIPKGPTGKLQRIGLAAKLGLPKDEAAAEAAGVDHTAPTTPVESLLVEAWQSVLRVDTVGIHARFLDLGGDSILAVQLLAEVHARLGVELTLEDVFDAPTVAVMAKVVEKKRHVAHGTAAATRRRPLARRTDLSRAPATFSQEWWLDYDEAWPGAVLSNRASSLAISGPLDVGLLGRSLEEVVRRHDPLRTRFHREDGVWFQDIAAFAGIALPIVDLTHLPETVRYGECLRLGLADAALAIDPESGPPIRAHLVRLAADRHVLLFTAHHAVFDGWSQSVLARDLATIYEALADGRRLPPPPARYGDYAAWQRGPDERARLKEAAAFWADYLEGPPPPLVLPTDRPRPPVPSHRTGLVERVLPVDLLQRVKALGSACDATPFITCLTAFAAALHGHSGQTDMMLGCISAGRDRPETRDLIGMFINVLVLRADLSGDPSLRELLVRNRDRALAAFDHRDYPFAEMLDLMGQPRGGPGIPLAPVIIQMRNFPDARQRAGNLLFDAFKYDTGVGRFDLTFDMMERADGLYLPVTFNQDILEGGTVDALIDDFQSVLERMVEDPDGRLSNLSAPRRRPKGGRRRTK